MDLVDCGGCSIRAGLPHPTEAPMDDAVKPRRGNFGSEDSGQTNDGPLDIEGKLLSGHASSGTR